MKRKRQIVEEEKNKPKKLIKFTPNKIKALKIIKENKEIYKKYWKYKNTKFEGRHLKILNEKMSLKKNCETLLIKLLKTYILEIISESKTKKKSLRKTVKIMRKNGDFLLNKKKKMKK